MNLIEAAKNGYYQDIIQCTNNKDIDLEQKDAQGFTPLLRAAENGHLSIVRLLLNLGADLTAVSHAGSNALLLACYNNRIEVAHFLLQDKNFPTNTKNKDGATPLHIVAGKGYLEICNDLINHQALVNSGDYVIDIDNQRAAGLTPLHIAASNGHHAIVISLLINGADPTLMNSNKETAIDLVTNEKIKNSLIENFIFLLLNEMVINKNQLNERKLLLLKKIILRMPSSHELMTTLKVIDDLNGSPLEIAKGFNRLLQITGDSIFSFFKGNPLFYYDYLLAICYANGISTPRNHQKALRHYLLTYHKMTEALNKASSPTLLEKYKKKLRGTCVDYVNSLEKSNEANKTLRIDIVNLYLAFYHDTYNQERISDLDNACKFKHGQALLIKASVALKNPVKQYETIAKYYYEAAMTDLDPDIKAGIHGIYQCVIEKNTVFTYAKKSCLALLCSDHQYQDMNEPYFRNLLNLLSSRFYFYRLANWIKIKLKNRIPFLEFIDLVTEIYHTGKDNVLEPTQGNLEHRKNSAKECLIELTQTDKLSANLKIKICLLLALKRTEPISSIYFAKAIELDVAASGTMVNSCLNNLINSNMCNLKSKAGALLNHLERNLYHSAANRIDPTQAITDDAQPFYPLLNASTEPQPMLDTLDEGHHLYPDYTRFALASAPLFDVPMVMRDNRHHDSHEYNLAVYNNHLAEHQRQQIEDLTDQLEKLSHERHHYMSLLIRADNTIEQTDTALQEGRLENQYVRREIERLKKENRFLNNKLNQHEEQKLKTFKFM